MSSYTLTCVPPDSTTGEMVRGGNNTLRDVLASEFVTDDLRALVRRKIASWGSLTAPGVVIRWKLSDQPDAGGCYSLTGPILVGEWRASGVMPIGAEEAIRQVRAGGKR